MGGAAPAAPPVFPMAYVAPDHIAYGLSQGATAFLDVRQDRYFRVRPDLDAVFQSALAGESDLARQPLADLLRLGLLVTSAAPTPRPAPTAPTESLLDADAVAARATLGEVIGAGVAFMRARRLRRTQVFEALVGRLRARKDRDATLVPGSSLEELQRLVGAFLAARRLAPWSPVCLLDSLALLEFLAPRGYLPDLVFGVSLAPFSAHCWVQTGALVLNDHLDHVSGHTPLLVI